MEWETLRVESEGAITLLTLDRPDRLNAINGRMTEELQAFWAEFDADPAQSVAVVTGAGDRAFCVGADLQELAELGELPRALQDPDVHVANRYTPAQCEVGKPTICAVNGVCAGGGLHFVTDCDIAIAGDSATFLDPHVSVGQVSALEPVSLLARGVPIGAVLRMALAGRAERIDAQRAYELGMVTEVVPAGDLLDAATRLAGVIAANSPAAIRVSRQAIWGALERPLDYALQHGWDLLRAHWLHPDFEEGPRAFAEKRPPEWRRE
jgi:E-phenylitaconyl-CoA hydratase